MVSATVGRPLCNAALRHSGISDHPIGWFVALASAFVGTYSHIGLDAVMHGDMNPFWPIVYGNGLLDLISVETLHVLCIIFGLLGGGFVGLRTLRDA
jgi:membrane-bound metal-dependent hydrolase YbcI (DUF457 family)